MIMLVASIVQYDELVIGSLGVIAAICTTLVGISTQVWQHCIWDFMDGVAWITINAGTN